MSTFEQCFREAEEIAMRFLQVDFGFVLKERRITDDGTNWTGGVARYESAGSRPNGPPRGWSVTLSFCPFRLELDLDISNEARTSYSVAELHQLEGSASLPAREHKAMRKEREQKAFFKIDKDGQRPEPTNDQRTS
jgi:hypothetical protein